MSVMQTSSELKGSFLEAAQNWCISDSVWLLLQCQTVSVYYQAFCSTVSIAEQCKVKETTKSMSVSREERGV